MLTVYFIEPWMVTLMLVIPFIRNIIVRMGFSNKWAKIPNESFMQVLSVTGGWSSLVEDTEEEDEDEDAAGGGGDKEGEKKSLKEKMEVGRLFKDKKR